MQGMTYYKHPLPKVQHEGFVCYYNSVQRSGLIRDFSGLEFPFNGSSVLCRRIECGDRVSFQETIDRGHPSACNINKF